MRYKMIKRILVPLDVSEYSKNALNVACTIAKYHKSEITGVTVLDMPGIKESLGTIPLGASFYARELTEVKMKEAEKRIDKLVEHFTSVCNEREIPHHVSKLQGLPSDRILEVSRYYDLLLLGKKTFFNFDSQDEPGDSFSRILDHSIIPVMAVPKEFSIDHLDHRPLKVMIAMDGSLPASKSMQMFAHLGIDEYCDIHMVMSSNDKEYAEFTLNEAEAFLNSHELSNVTKIHTKKNIVEIIEEDYLEWADMFVIGLHSKPAILDFFTGNVTNFVIDKSKKAIFIGL